MADHTNEPIIPVSDEDFLYYHHDDHLGSSHVLTEGKDKGYHSGVTYNKGDLLQRFEYEPFGREKYVLNPNLNIDPSYTGQTYDVESGLYYYHARYYDPTLGRFIQPDTLVPDAKNLQAFNRYSYVVNNPFKYTDPSGHGALDWFKKIFGAFIGALVSVVTFGALAPAGFTLASLTFGQAVIFGTISGVAGGVIGGAITGGLRGAALGGAFGFLGGAGFGAIGYGFAKVLSAGMTMAVMGGIGLGLSYGTGGWEGLVTFGAGLAGGFVGGKISNGLKGATDAGASASAEAEEEILYAQFSNKTGIQRYIMSEGGGGGGLGIGGFGKGGGKYYRYVGAKEAQIIKETGKIPNIKANQSSKNIHYTNESFNSATEAQQRLSLPDLPSHRVTIDPQSVKAR